MRDGTNDAIVRERVEPLDTMSRGAKHQPWIDEGDRVREQENRHSRPVATLLTRDIQVRKHEVKVSR